MHILFKNGTNEPGIVKVEDVRYLGDEYALYVSGTNGEISTAESTAHVLQPGETVKVRLPAGWYRWRVTQQEPWTFVDEEE